MGHTAGSGRARVDWYLGGNGRSCIQSKKFGNSEEQDSWLAFLLVTKGKEAEMAPGTKILVLSEKIPVRLWPF